MALKDSHEISQPFIQVKALSREQGFPFCHHMISFHDDFILPEPN